MKSYLRFLNRNKRYTAIQVVGLSVSLAFVIILTSWLVNIFKMGREHPEYDDIYAVCYNENLNTTWALGTHLSENFPEIESTTAMLLFPGHFSLKNAEYVKIYWCDENFFEFFPREFIAGDASFLKVSSEVGISETFARKHFHGEDPIGKTVTLKNVDYIVSAVYKDFGDGLMKYQDMIMPMSARGTMQHVLPKAEMYGMVTMIRFKDGVDITMAQDKIKNDIIKYYKGIGDQRVAELIKEYGEDHTEYAHNVVSRVIGDNHCRFIRYDEITYDETNEYFTLNTRFSIKILVILVVILLITALANYVNLNVALAGKRARETATKNLLGSQKSAVYLQYFREAFIITVFSTILGICLAVSVLPLVNSMMQGYDGLGSTFNIAFEPLTIAAILSLLFVTSILSSLIPAYYLSQFSALDVTKGTFRFNRKTILNKVFICIQTVFSVLFLTFSMILQVGYHNMLNAESGFEHEDLFYLVPSDDLRKDITGYNALKNELEKIPEISAIDYTYSVPFNCYAFQLSIDGSEDNLVSLDFVECTQAAFDIFGFEILSRQFNDSRNGVWLTESLAEIVDENQSLLERILGPGSNQILGVIKGFRTSGIPSMDKKAGLILIDDRISDFGSLIMRTTGDHEAVRKLIAKTYEKVSGCYVNDPKNFGRGAMYLTEILEEDLQKIDFIKNVVTGIALMIVLIAILGLTGMSIYYADENTHQTAVRKVFGGTVGSETRRTLNSFLKITLIANLVAVPVTVYLAMKQTWFNLATIPGWGWFVALATLVSFTISTLAVLWQTLHAARTNPAEALKKE